jgi:alkylhydroperoxidase family enzyme
LADAGRDSWASHPWTRVPDIVYEEARRHFDEAEPVELGRPINAWNRAAISFRQVHPMKPNRAAA